MASLPMNELEWDGQVYEMVDKKGREDIAKNAKDVTDLKQDLYEIEENLSPYKNLLGRYLEINIGYFTLTDFDGGNSQLNRAKSEIITGRGTKVELTVPDGIKANVVELVNGETNATYVVSGLTGKDVFLFSSDARYRLSLQKTDGTNFEIDKLPKVYYRDLSDDLKEKIFETNDTVQKLFNIKQKTVIKNLLIFDKNTTEITGHEFISGSFNALSKGEKGLFTVNNPSENIIVVRDVHDCKKISISITDIDDINFCVVVSLNESAKKAQFVRVNKGEVYLVDTAYNYRAGNYSKNLGTIGKSYTYDFEICGDSAVITSEIGKKLVVEKLLYSTNKIGICFTSTSATSQSIKAATYYKNIYVNNYELDKEILQNTEHHSGIIQYSFSTSNPNAIISKTSGPIPYLSFNCDKKYGMANYGSGRYRSELSLPATDELIPKGKVSYEFYLPSQLNEVDDTTDDIILQLHDGGGKYTDYALAPPIAIAVNGGKLCLYHAYNRNEPQAQNDWTQVKYELCNCIYDEWVRLEVEYQSGYTEYANPYTIVKVNGLTVANLHTLNGMKFDTPCYWRIGLYERQWYWLEPIHDTRTIYIRNIKCEI